MKITIDTDTKTIELDGNLEEIQAIDISAHLECGNTSLEHKVTKTDNSFYGIPKTTTNIEHQSKRIDGKTTIVYEME